MNDDLRKLLMAGIGAASMAAEKTQEAVETLAKRGEEAVQQGKVFNEQLRHEIKQAVKENVTVVETELDKDAVLSALENLSPEELAAVKAKLDGLNKPAEESADEQAK